MEAADVAADTTEVATNAIEVATDVLAVARVHASTIVDRNQGLALTFTAIPRDAFQGRPPEDLGDVVEGLGAELLVELPQPAASFLPHAIACVLQDTDPGVARDRLDMLLGTPPREGLADLDPGVLAFAEFCAFTPIVPTEESKISAKVMVQIVGFGGIVGVATLAAAPVVVAVGSAAGTVVVLSAAVGVGDRVYNWIAP